MVRVSPEVTTLSFRGQACSTRSRWPGGVRFCDRRPGGNSNRGAWFLVLADFCAESSQRSPVGELLCPHCPWLFAGLRSAPPDQLRSRRYLHGGRLYRFLSGNPAPGELSGCLPFPSRADGGLCHHRGADHDSDRRGRSHPGTGGLPATQAQGRVPPVRGDHRPHVRPHSRKRQPGAFRRQSPDVPRAHSQHRL